MSNLPKVPVNDKSYYTVEEVAKILQIAPKTVRNLFARGRFPNAHKIDPETPRSPIRIPFDDVVAFITRQQQQNRPAN